MATYIPKHIFEIIEDIEDQKIVLPAIQREYVWLEDGEEGICNLFESLMRNYPIGTFLFWNIKKERINVSGIILNSFISQYDEQKDIKRGDKINVEKDEYLAVLDGQQRLTSLYIGLCGVYRKRIKGKNKNKDESYINKKLCIDILSKVEREDDKYHFDFRKYDDFIKIIENEGKKELWIPVSEVYDPNFDNATYIENLEKKFPEISPSDIRVPARKMLDTLHTAIFKEINIYYFEAKNQSLNEIVDIFVRVNSGGEKLKPSDLMLSIATGIMGEDIYVKMNEAIDLIKSSVKDPEKAIKVDKELIMTAGLLFTGSKSVSLLKEDNYSRERLKKIMDSWDKIIDSICNASSYLEKSRFDGKNLTSKNLILPIAYYFYVHNLDDGHFDKGDTRATKDRIFIRQWLLRAMIKSIFSDGIGSTLLYIRNIIDSSRKDAVFPLCELMKKTNRRSLDFTDDTIDEIINIKYGDVRIRPLLIELSQFDPIIDYEIDHMWPQKVLKNKNDIKKLLPLATEEEIKIYKDKRDRLSNLQLLTATENNQKNDRFFNEWINDFHNNPHDDIYDKNFIPKNMNYEFDNFLQFIEERTKLLKEGIKKAFPKDYDDILIRYNLKSK